MGKKYIIELEDKPFHKEDGDFLYRVKGFNNLVFDMTGIGMLTPYTEPDLEQVRCQAYEEGRNSLLVEVQKAGKNTIKLEEDEYYQRGLSDAWEAAKKLWDLKGEMIKAFRKYSVFDILNCYTAAEVIEKLKQYEQEKEEKQHTWICSEAGEPSTDITLICSKCGYTITIKPGDTQALNFCPKCGDNKRGERDE